MSTATSERGLQFSDYAILALFSLMLFGYAIIGGRVLSMHESRLPEASREMYADGDLLIPKCGGRPWLERPPLPHWATVAVATVFGRCDEVWIVRIPSVLTGTFCVLLVAWIASQWYARHIALLSGLTLATMIEFTRYAWLAEEDIYVAAAVLLGIALFVKLEFNPYAPTVKEPNRLFGLRSRYVVAFFLVAGLSNLVKGLWFAAAIICIPVAGFLLWNADAKKIRRYVWFWGWILAAVTSVSWLAIVSIRHPDVWDIGFRDVTDRTDGSWADPFWYYPVNMLWLMAPWTLSVILGIAGTWKTAWRERYSPERFLWCWSLLPLIVLSIPAHKHHHYLVPCLAPWAIFGAMGTVRIWKTVTAWPLWRRHPAWSLLTVTLPAAIAIIVLRDKLPGPGWIIPVMIGTIAVIAFGITWAMQHSHGQRAALTLFGLLTVAYLAGHTYTGMYLDRYIGDSVFLDEVKTAVPDDAVVLINADDSNLNMFRHAFYLADRGQVIHNLTFLRDDSLRDDDLYVIARYQELEHLNQMGTAEPLVESNFHQRKEPAASRWTLFKFRRDPAAPKFSTSDVHYTALQVMERQPGPFLGTQLR